MSEELFETYAAKYPQYYKKTNRATLLYEEELAVRSAADGLQKVARLGVFGDAVLYVVHYQRRVLHFVSSLHRDRVMRSRAALRLGS